MKNKKDTLYYELADYYWLYSSKKNYKKETYFLKKIINEHSLINSKILDVGCGEGDHLFNLKNKKNFCFGIDKSEFQINKARKKYPSLKFQVLDITKENLNEKFDVVIVMWNTLLYFSPKNKLEQAIKNIKKMLNPDGILLFDFRSFYLHIKNKEFSKNLERVIEKNGYRMILKTKNTLNKNKTFTEKTHSWIFLKEKLILEKEHSSLDLNILSLLEVKKLLNKNGFKVQEVFDIKSIQENRKIFPNLDTRGYFVVAKNSIKN